MEKEQSYSEEPMGQSFSGFEQDYTLPPQSSHLLHPLPQDQIKPITTETPGENGDVSLSYLHPPMQQISPLGFSDVMQFADFGPKLSLYGQTTNKLCSSDENEDSGGLDPVYFLKFPVLNERSEGEELGDSGRVSGQSPGRVEMMKNKRKRGRSAKTSEEVESQRMTHIAVERNRRKQMNEHLRVLRSLMPGSYVQRGDQASIIGGAIEFVRELEQLLQCLESQKRRRLIGEAGLTDSAQLQPQPQPTQYQNDSQMKIMDLETTTTGLMLREEETAESKSCLADVEVKLIGFDAMIKILSRRRPGQLLKAIAALQDLQLNILHTNITTIEQTVLYSFNVKVGSESRFTAEDIASSVQQIFGFIHANSGM